MRAFTTLRAVAAPLPEANVDTDKIIPARFLKTVTRKGLGKALFNDIRYARDGTPKADFVFNEKPWMFSGILVAGENFGCGSSREHAPWALSDFGITCIIAPSFADIFYNNCFKNGILPIVLSADECETLIRDCEVAATAIFTVDLPQQFVQRSSGDRSPFFIDASRKVALLEGRDDIATTLAKAGSIDAFEAASRTRIPAMPTIPVDLISAIDACASR